MGGEVAERVPDALENRSNRRLKGGRGKPRPYAARTLRVGAGLAPAHRGEPGYYARHDEDDDGIACEPYFDKTSFKKPPLIRVSP